MIISAITSTEPALAGSTATATISTGGQAPGGADFGSVLEDLAKQTASALRAGEDAAIKGIQGQAPVQDVVRAVMNAQTSLQTALAIRDKAISAIQDLTRMPI